MQNAAGMQNAAKMPLHSPARSEHLRLPGGAAGAMDLRLATRAGANPLVARVLTLALCRAGTGDTCAIWIVGGFAASQGSGREQEDCRTARARRLRRGDMNWSHCFRPSSLTGSIQIVISRTGCCVAQQLRPVHKGCCGEHASTRLLGKGCCAERVATPPLPRVAARERVAARSAYHPRQPSPRG